MRKLIFIIVAVFGVLILAAAQDAPKATATKPIVKAVSSEQAAALQRAQVDLQTKQAALAGDAVYQAFLAAQNNYRAELLAILADVGIKPTEFDNKLWQPVIDKTGTLTGFEFKGKP